MVPCGLRARSFRTDSRCDRLRRHGACQRMSGEAAGHADRHVRRGSRESATTRGRSAPPAVARLRGGARLAGGVASIRGACPSPRRHPGPRAGRARGACCLSRALRRNGDARGRAGGCVARGADRSPAGRLPAREACWGLGCAGARRHRGPRARRPRPLCALSRHGAHRPPFWSPLSSARRPIGQRGIDLARSALTPKHLGLTFVSTPQSAKTRRASSSGLRHSV